MHPCLYGWVINMHPLLKNWKVVFAIAAVLLSVVIMLFNGLKLGADFTGGAVLIFQFDRPLTPDEMKEAVAVLERRLNWTGLMDVTIRPWGDRFLFVRIGDVDEGTIQFVKDSVLKQGLFEAVADGKVVLKGSDVIVKGEYEILPDNVNGGYVWRVPFLLTEEGAERFFKGLKSVCSLDSCPDIYFFIDRPVGYSIVLDENLYTKELQAFKEQFPNGDINELKKNAGVKIYIIEYNRPENNEPVILPSVLSYLKDEFNNVKVAPYSDGFLARVSGLRSIVGVSPDLRYDIVTSGSPTTTSLMISGFAPNREEAQRRVDELLVILSSGSLPAPISLVSEYIIPPEYGFSSFLTFMAALVVAMVSVAAFIALRYRKKEIFLPISATILSEVILVLGFASLIGWRLDIPSLVGMIAAVGSGVDDQIIITDEMLRRRQEIKKELSLITRVKRAFFVVFASASSLGAVMIPMWFSGIPSLMGFALTTLAGILLGVLITRPAYAEVLKYLLSKQERE